jgi:hypothetical protein
MWRAYLRAHDDGAVSEYLLTPSPNADPGFQQAVLNIVRNSETRLSALEIAERLLRQLAPKSLAATESEGITQIFVLGVAKMVREVLGREPGDDD